MIALACDHGALDLKNAIMKHLEQRGLAYKDFGCYTKDSCDYPDFAGPAAQAVASGECDRGIGLLHDRYRRVHHGQQGQRHPLCAARQSHVRKTDP